MDRQSKIYVAGHRGLVGSAIVRRLQKADFQDVITADREVVDLTNQNAVKKFFDETRPEYVFLAAAKVGGIYANNTYPADFIRDNILIQTNVIDIAHKYGVRKLLFLGSSCIYPKMAPQPIKEDYLLTGSLESTNEAYAVAKIAGITMCKSYRYQYGFDAISLMPTNLYGPKDNFDPMSSHVLPALIRKFHEAKVTGASFVTAWGTGTPLREFLHVDDLADACLFLMENYDSEEIINVGTGEDLSIGELISIVAEIIGYEGDIVYDTSKPDGTPRKLLDVSKLKALGWAPSIGLRSGIEDTYRWYLENVS